ncbi:heat shock protein 70 kDa 12B [Ceratobasidium sp. AG-Ba]|nr:heat shock protein 70 kDa 12B [Ceratobasidium sp. AG-Ba]
MNHSSINPSPKTFHGSWDGPSKIVLGIDIGTTQSGVAFTYLQEGVEKSIHRVVQWPGQESQNQQSKIPSMLWYDANNRAVSIGAEALTPQAEEDAEDHHWRPAKHFKLHLHPEELIARHGLEINELPGGVEISQVYTDFLRYLLQHTRTYFEDHILDGKHIWETYQPKMEVVLAHPNGWGIREQYVLRSATVAAGFVDGKDADSRIHFVSEAEASVHFCIYHTNLGSQLKTGVTFAVCDAGGSTVDTTVYSVETTAPLRLAETRASACVQAGAIFVDAAAKSYLKEVLKNAGISPEDVEEYVSRGVKDFESNAKRAFRDATAGDLSIAIAGTRFNNPSIRAWRGRMNVPGDAVKQLFDFCLDQIIGSVESQLESTVASYILLVGGFGESLYLREQLKARFEPIGCQITTTNDATSKAVADGALVWFCSSNVTKRAPRFSYGIEIFIPYDSSVQAHKRRKTIFWPSGQFARGGWSQIVSKGDPIDCNTVIRRPYYREYSSPNPDLTRFKEVIWSYSLPGLPDWMRFKPGSLMPGFKSHKTTGGSSYWSLSFNVCIHFGRTELEAFLEWTENGVVRTGPARIVSTTDLA